jgi:glycosyltransferase involved in cell wall biosynthesis
MVNSSWTAAHVRQVWWMWDEPALVYPPCDTTDLQSLPLDRRLKHLFLVSVAQFRPEKNHRLQLEAYAMAREQAGEHDHGLQCDYVCIAGASAVHVLRTRPRLQLAAYAMARDQAGGHLACWLWLHVHVELEAYAMSLLAACSCQGHQLRSKCCPSAMSTSAG